MRLVKTERNAIIEAIEAAGLDPTEFDIGDDGDETRISHRGSESAFVLHEDGTSYSGSKAVGDGLPQPVRFGTWDSLVEYIALVWLKEVKLDLDTPDRWAELQQEREILTTASTEDTENTPFTADEQAEIAKQLREIKEYVKKTYGLTASQMHALEAGLDDLEVEAARMGRRNWFALVVGTLTILQAVLPPGATRHVFLMLLRSLAHLHGFPELPGGG